MADQPLCSRTPDEPAGCTAYSVTARQNWPYNRVAYPVRIDTDGTTSKSLRIYWWPHAGLRVAHRSAAEPTTEAGRGGDLPRPPRRLKLA
ncbi:hypothetical protein ABZT23_30120 [Streptomyces sp. NPDC005386]|uniref:hypothetical protein n=1 Tax=Streptomyces sp. NPDC005386 TaxID=3154562 RepID=UPI0033AF443F